MESPVIRPAAESPKNSLYDYRSEINSVEVTSEIVKTTAEPKDQGFGAFRTTRIPISTSRCGKSSFPLQFASRDSGIATTINLNESTDQSQSTNKQKITSGNKFGGRLIHIGSLKPSQIPLRKHGTITIISDTKSEGHTEKSTNKNVHTVPLIHKPDLETEAPLTCEPSTRFETSPRTSTLRQSDELICESDVKEKPFDTLLSYPRSQSTGFSLDSYDTSERDVYNDQITGFSKGEKVTAVYDSIVMATNKIKAVNENVSRWLINEFRIPIMRHRKTSSTCRYCNMTESSKNSDETPTYRNLIRDNLNHCVKNDQRDTWNDIQTAKDTKSLKRINSKVPCVAATYKTGTATYMALESNAFKRHDSITGVNIDLQYPSNSTMRTTHEGITVPSYTVCPSEVLQKTTNFECFESITNSMATDLDIRANISSQFSIEHPDEYAIMDAWCPHSCQSHSFVNHAKCTKCAPDKADWVLRDNQDGFSDGTNKDSIPMMNKQMFFCNEVNKNTRGLNCNNNSGKSQLPSKKYKVCRQVRTLRSRYLQQRRWIHMWKKKVNWHTWARSPFKFKKFRMLHHMQRAVIWEDAHVQTSIVVFREIGIGMALWQLKSACVTTSANFGFLNKSVDLSMNKSEVQEKVRSSLNNYKIPFKNVNIGPSRFPFSGNSHGSSLPVSKKPILESIKDRRESTSAPSKTFGFFNHQPKTSLECYIHKDEETNNNQLFNPIEFTNKIMETTIGTCTDKTNRSLSAIDFENEIKSTVACTETIQNQLSNPKVFEKKITDYEGPHNCSCTVAESKRNHCLPTTEFGKKITDTALCIDPKMNGSLSPIIEMKSKIKEAETINKIEFQKKITDNVVCIDTTSPKLPKKGTEIPTIYSPKQYFGKVFQNSSTDPIEYPVGNSKTIRPKLTKKEVSITEVSQKVMQNTSTETIQMVEDINTQTAHHTKSVGVSKSVRTNEDQTQMTPSPTRDHLKLFKSSGTQQSHDQIKYNVANKQMGTEILKYDKQTMKSFRLENRKSYDKRLPDCRRYLEKKSSNYFGIESQLAITYQGDQDSSLSSQSYVIKKPFDIGVKPCEWDYKTIQNIDKSPQESKTTIDDSRQSYHNMKSVHKSDIGHHYVTKSTHYIDMNQLPSSTTYLLERSQNSHKILIDTGQSCYKVRRCDTDTQAYFEPTTIPIKALKSPAETNLNLAEKKHLPRTANQNGTSQSTLVKSIYQPFLKISEAGTMSISTYHKSVGMLTIEMNDKSVMHLETKATVSKSTSTGSLTRSKSTGSSAIQLKNITLDAYAQYSTYKYAELTNNKMIQTDREIKSASVLTSSMHVDKFTESQTDEAMFRKCNQYQEALALAAAQCKQSAYIPLAQAPPLTDMVLEENDLENLVREPKMRGNPVKKLATSAPALYDVDDFEYSQWSRDHRNRRVPETYPESEEAKLAKLISHSCRSKKSKSPFVRAGRSALRHSAPKPFEKLSKDSIADVFSNDIPEYDLYPKKLSDRSEEIAVFHMPVMLDKETSDTKTDKSKNFKESVLQTSPDCRDAETDSVVCHQRSAGVLTSLSLLPKPMFYPYPEINPLADCVFLYDPPTRAVDPTGLNTTVQKFSMHESSYAKLVKSMNVMTDGAEAFGFISTGTSTRKASPTSNELIRTCSKNYHARVLHLPPFFDQGPKEEQLKKPMFGSCRYYSNLLTKQLVRMKENLKQLKNAEECALYQHVSSVHCQQDTACMIPSGRVELCCQTAKLSKISTPLSRCVMAPSVTNIGDGQDKKQLRSIYYMLTAIEGRIRRLKLNIPDSGSYR